MKWKIDHQIGQFQAKNLIFLAIFILTKITFFVDGHRLMTYWFFLSSTYFLSEKYNFDSIKVIWGTFLGTWKFQINKEMLISWKECVIPVERTQTDTQTEKQTEIAKTGGPIDFFVIFSCIFYRWAVQQTEIQLQNCQNRQKH